MSDFDVTSAWRERLHQEHPALALRMVKDAANRDTEVSLKEQIYDILMESLDPIPTSRELWCEIKAEKIE